LLGSTAGLGFDENTDLDASVFANGLPNPAFVELLIRFGDGLKVNDLLGSPELNERVGLGASSFLPEKVLPNITGVPVEDENGELCFG